MPATGRYVNEPALTNENGVVSIPKAVEEIPMVVKTLGVALGLVAIGFLAYQQVKRIRESEAALELA